MQKVFVSSTSLDLRSYRTAVREVVLEQDWHPVMMEHFGTSPETTLQACRRKVRECDLVLLLVAFRLGWVPTADQGGDGQRAVTAFEFDEARRIGIPVRVMMARETWPGNLWENDQQARETVRRFREGLNQIAAFFDCEMISAETTAPHPGREFRSLVPKVLLDHRESLSEHTTPVASPMRRAGRAVGTEAVLPRLEALIEGVVVPYDDLGRVYRSAVPAGWESPPADRNPVNLLAWCVRSLARVPRQAASGQFPLLRFVAGLTNVLADQPRLGEALRSWVNDTVAALGTEDGRANLFSSAREELSKADPPTGVDTTCHLLVQVSPRLCEAGAFGVKAWLFGTGEPACLAAGEEALTRDHLPGCLDALREELVRRGIAPENVWIELLLPRALLCADVDQWAVALDFIDAVPVGVEHRLVVRSLERASRPLAAQALLSRWRAIRGGLQGPCLLRETPSAGFDFFALWIEADDCGGPALYTTLKNEPKLIAAVLGRPPRTEPGDPSRDVLNTLFAAGVAVVVWVRQGEPAAARAAIDELLRSEPPARLPDRIWDLRKQAVRSADLNHPGRHVTLLWDDPTRPSPDLEPSLRLRPPSRSAPG